MQVEPPSPHVPDHGNHVHPPVGALRLSAALGAAALAIASSGHLFVLAGLIAAAAPPRGASSSGRARLGAATVALACSAVLVRWGAPTLSAVGGGQAVLGPAITVGSTAAAASAALAALAIALLAPPVRRASWDLLIAACFGVVVGAVAAGPTLPNDLGVRVAGIVVGVGLAVGASRLPARGLVAAAACASGALALVLAVLA